MNDVLLQVFLPRKFKRYEISAKTILNVKNVGTEGILLFGYIVGDRSIATSYELRLNQSYYYRRKHGGF